VRAGGLSGEPERSDEPGLGESDRSGEAGGRPFTRGNLPGATRAGRREGNCEALLRFVLAGQSATTRWQAITAIR
jgi:hypothetical protein